STASSPTCPPTIPPSGMSASATPRARSGPCGLDCSPPMKASSKSPPLFLSIIPRRSADHPRDGKLPVRILFQHCPRPPPPSAAPVSHWRSAGGQRHGHDVAPRLTL